MRHFKNNWSFVASVIFTAMSGMLCPLCWLMVESKRKGVGRILSQAYGSGGLLLALILAVLGIVASIVSIRAAKKSASSSNRLKGSIATLVVCCLLCLLSLAKFLGV